MSFNMNKRRRHRQQANRENHSPSNQMICTAVYPMDCKEVSSTCPQVNFETASTAVVQAAVAQWLQQHCSSDATELDTCKSMLKKGDSHEEVAQQDEKQARYRMHCTVVRDMDDSEYSWDFFKEQVNAIQRLCGDQEEEHKKMIREMQQQHQKALERLKEHVRDSFRKHANKQMLYECDSTCEPSECNSEEWIATDITVTQQILVHKESEVVNNANRVPRLQISTPIISSCTPSLAPSFPVVSARGTARSNPPVAPPFPPVPPPSSIGISKFAPE